MIEAPGPGPDPDGGVEMTDAEYGSFLRAVKGENVPLTRPLTAAQGERLIGLVRLTRAAARESTLARTFEAEKASADSLQVILAAIRELTQ